MTAPIGAHIRERFESMGDTMVQFLFIWVGFCVGLAYTLGDHFPVALLVAGVFAILTLHTC